MPKDKLFPGLMGWKIEENALKKEYLFRNFVEAWSFMEQAALIAEELGHHPDWSNSYNRVSVTLITHDTGGVTELDLELARRMDTLLADIEEVPLLVPESRFMRAAIDSARSSTSPFVIHHIGAVIAKDGEIVSAEPNQTKESNDSTMHAEVAAIRKAYQLLGTRKLHGCILYTTHEPCAMCAGAVIWSRLDGMVSGATLKDMLAAKDGEGNPVWANPAIHIPVREVFARSVPRIPLAEGFMREECKALFS